MRLPFAEFAKTMFISDLCDGGSLRRCSPVVSGPGLVLPDGFLLYSIWQAFASDVLDVTLWES